MRIAKVGAVAQTHADVSTTLLAARLSKSSTNSSSRKSLPLDDLSDRTTGELLMRSSSSQRVMFPSCSCFSHLATALLRLTKSLRKRLWFPLHCALSARATHTRSSQFSGPHPSDLSRASAA